MTATERKCEQAIADQDLQDEWDALTPAARSAIIADVARAEAVRDAGFLASALAAWMCDAMGLDAAMAWGALPF